MTMTRGFYFTYGTEQTEPIAGNQYRVFKRTRKGGVQVDGALYTLEFIDEHIVKFKGYGAKYNRADLIFFIVQN